MVVGPAIDLQYWHSASGGSVLGDLLLQFRRIGSVRSRGGQMESSRINVQKHPGFIRRILPRRPTDLLLRLRQRPFARFVPDFVAGQPAPRGLDGEDAGELRRVPPTAIAGRTLPPQT